jgi:hypothetical protein
LVAKDQVSELVPDGVQLKAGVEGLVVDDQVRCAGRDAQGGAALGERGRLQQERPAAAFLEGQPEVLQVPRPGDGQGEDEGWGSGFASTDVVYGVSDHDVTVLPSFGVLP